MTKDEIELAVRLNIEDKFKSKFGDDDMLSIMNRAYQFVYNKLIASGLYTNSAEGTVTILADTREIVIPHELAKIIFVETTTGIRLPIMDEVLCRTSRMPAVYLKHIPGTRFTSLGYYITTSSALSLCYTYIVKFVPFLLTDAGTLEKTEIPQDHHDVVVSYASVIGLGIDEDASVNFWMDRFNAGFADMLEALQLTGGVDDQVTDVMDD